MSQELERKVLENGNNLKISIGILKYQFKYLPFVHMSFNQFKYIFMIYIYLK